MEWEEFERKLNICRELTKDNWWLRGGCNAPLHKFLWKCKIQIKPVLFANPIYFALISSFFWGVWMYIFFFFVSYFFELKPMGAQPTEKLALIALTLVLCSLGFGTLLSATFYTLARYYKLPKWDDL